MSTLKSLRVFSCMSLLLFAFSACQSALLTKRMHRKGFHITLSPVEKSPAQREKLREVKFIGRNSESQTPSADVTMKLTDAITKGQERHFPTPIKVSTNIPIPTKESSLSELHPVQAGPSAVGENDAEDSKETRSSAIFSLIFAGLSLLSVALVYVSPFFLFLFPPFAIVALGFGLHSLFNIYIRKKSVPKRIKYFAFIGTFLGFVGSILTLFFLGSLSMF